MVALGRCAIKNSIFFALRYGESDFLAADYEKGAMINTHVFSCSTCDFFASHILIFSESYRPSVRPFVRLPVRPSVCPSVRLSVRPSVRPS